MKKYFLMATLALVTVALIGCKDKKSEETEDPGQQTEQGSAMAWGLDPDAMTADPYTGAYDAVYTSVAKLVAAGADWLYDLPQWEDIFDEDTRKRLYKEQKDAGTFRRTEVKIMPNDPCPCGSGKKYKRCHGR